MESLLWITTNEEEPSSQENHNWCNLWFLPWPTWRCYSCFVGLLCGQRNMVAWRFMQITSLGAFCEFLGPLLGHPRSTGPSSGWAICLYFMEHLVQNAIRIGSPSLPHSLIHADAIERLQEFQQVNEWPSTLLQPSAPSTGFLPQFPSAKPTSMGPFSRARCSKPGSGY